MRAGVLTGIPFVILGAYLHSTRQILRIVFASKSVRSSKQSHSHGRKGVATNVSSVLQYTNGETLSNDAALV